MSLRDTDASTASVPPCDIFFIRAALHLRRRAEREGIVFAPTQLCAGGRFSLSPGLLYEFALGDEPERLAHAPFRDVRRQDPPREFIQLWLDDTSRWERSSKEERESA